MKMLVRAALWLSAFLACAPVAADVLLLPQVKNAAGANVPSQAAVAADRNGAARDNSGAALTGSLSAAGVSMAIGVRGDFNFSLFGSGSWTCGLDRSFDAGSTWLPLTQGGVALAFSVAVSEIETEPEAGVSYRVDCPTIGASSTVNYRVSQ